MTPIKITRKLTRDLRGLEFSSPVTHVYNPLEYARASHEIYLEKYGSEPREVVLLGMNPGPWGMVQTGIPFGEIEIVRNWLDIETEVGKPKQEHPKRPVDGFACKRREVSGARLWGWAQSHFGKAESFFEQFVVLNYCPLAFLEESGRNRTPDKLAPDERAALFAICDAALRKLMKYYQPRLVVGIGTFAEQRAIQALEGMDLEIGRILHPSPASPMANRGWAPVAEKQLEALGVTI